MDLTVQLSNPRDALRHLAEQDIRTRLVPPCPEPEAVLAPSGRRAVRQPQRRLKPNEIEALVAAYRGGMTMKDLARTFGIHRVTVSAHLRQHGVAIRGQGLAHKDIPKAARLYEDGWSSLSLGEKFGVSPDTVLAALRRARVHIRPGKGGPSKRHP